MANCYKCCTKLEYAQGEVGRGESCPNCRFDVRVCYNCGFYDKSSYNECREPQADRVVDKAKSNFCDFFKLSGSERRPNEAGSNKLKKLDDLFK